MKTTPRPHDVERFPVDRTAGVECFFDSLKQAQTSFLDAVGRAHPLLGRESGQLAQVAAIQGRLTRQFFDAQRSILMRRSEIDAEVRSMTDAASLTSVIDDAFEPDEPSGAVAERQLAALLDEWWRLENRQGRAVVEVVEAGRRAADRTGTALTHDERSPLLPLYMVAALDTADPDDLHTLLDALADSLAPPPTEVAPLDVRRVDDLVIRLDRAPSTPQMPEVPEEAFRRFWDKASVSHTSRRSWRWIPVRVVLPMTAVTSALALFMAVIG